MRRSPLAWLGRTGATGRPSRPGERGAVTVELGLLLPVLSVVLVGLVSTGLALTEQMAMESATHEGARAGAVLPYDEPPPGFTWIEAIEGLTLAGVHGEESAVSVCVALVDTVTGQPVASSLTSNTDGSACFVEQATDGLRVQVAISKPTVIEAVFYSQAITLESRASSRYELPRPL